MNTYTEALTTTKSGNPAFVVKMPEGIHCIIFPPRGRCILGHVYRVVRGQHIRGFLYEAASVEHLADSAHEYKEQGRRELETLKAAGEKKRAAGHATREIERQRLIGVGDQSLQNLGIDAEDFRVAFNPISELDTALGALGYGVENFGPTPQGVTTKQFARWARTGKVW